VPLSRYSFLFAKAPERLDMLLTVNKIISWHDDEAGLKWDERVLHHLHETG